MNALVHSVLRSPRLAVAVTRGGRDLIDDTGNAWRELCDAGRQSLFCRPEWVTAYLDAFCRSARLMLLTVQEDSTPVAVLPLVEKTTFCGLPARTLRTPGNFHSCRFEIAIQSDKSDAVLGVLWEYLKQEAEWDVLELANVPENSVLEGLLDMAQRDGWLTGRWPTEDTPYMDLAGIMEPEDVIPKGDFRRNIHRRIRRASEKWDVELIRVESFESPYLNEFYSLEMSGWKGSEGTAIACLPSTRLFYDQIAKAATGFGYFRLHMLRFDKRVVAGQFGLEYGQRYYSLKIAYDEQYASASPGNLLVQGILRDCIRRGIIEYDMLGPTAPWKRKWTAKARQHSNCYIFRKNARGLLSYMTKMEIMRHLRWAAQYPLVELIRKKMTSANK